MPNSSAYQPAAVRDGLPMPERRLAMVVIVLGIFVAVLDGSIMNLALPTVAKSLAVTPSEAIWVVNAYQLGTLGLLLPLAALGERIGYRKVYLVGMVCFTLASAVAMLANSFWVLVLARGLQGMGAAGVMAVNAALVRLTYPASKLGKGMALNSLVVAVASVTGPGVAALILSVASWQWLFAINVPLGLLTLWLGRRALPGNPQQLLDAPHAKLTPTDVLLNFAMFALVFLGAERVGARHDAAVSSAASGWLMLGLGLALGGWYVLRQRRLALPLLPLDLLRIPVFALSMGASVGAFTAHMLSFIALPFLLLDALHRSHFAAGMLMTAWSVAIVVVAPVAGKLIGRVADGLLGGIGMAILALGLLSLGFLPADPSDLNIGWRMALCGVGFALFQSPNNHTIVSSAPLHRSGGASGMLGTARLTGQTLGAVLLAAIFALRPGHDGSAESLALLLAAGWAVAAGVCSSLRVRQGPV